MWVGMWGLQRVLFQKGSAKTQEPKESLFNCGTWWPCITMFSGSCQLISLKIPILNFSCVIFPYIISKLHNFYSPKKRLIIFIVYFYIKLIIKIKRKDKNKTRSVEISFFFYSYPSVFLSPQLQYIPALSSSYFSFSFLIGHMTQKNYAWFSSPLTTTS